MLRTLAINSNKKCVKFWCFDSLLITKAIWDWGELLGIHARSIPGQGVRIHHRRASRQHIQIRCYRFIEMERLPPLHPVSAIVSGCRRFPLGCITSGNLLPPPLHPDILHPAHDAGWEKRVFQLLRTYISGSSNSAYPESFANNFVQCCGVLLKLPDICHRYFGIFWDILL